MTKRFAIGFGVGLLIFLTINLLAAHLASDCGLLAVFGRDVCADDIARAGWPLQFYEEGGFAYHRDVNLLFLLINLCIGVAFALLSGWLFLLNKKTISK
jgi:hypothetical protein